jgi:hypothetical protein
MLHSTHERHERRTGLAAELEYERLARRQLGKFR